MSNWLSGGRVLGDGARLLAVAYADERVSGA